MGPRVLWIAGLVTGLVLTGVVALSFRAQEDRTCEVIRAFKTEILDQTPDLAPLMAPRAEPTSEAWYLLWPTLPFDPENGEVARIVFTTPYAPQLALRPPRDFRSCFDRRPAPSFYEGRFSDLDIAAMQQAPYPMLWRLSPVGFVGDREAIFYAEYACGGLCAGGGFYLWRRTTRGWRFVGYCETWVS